MTRKKQTNMENHQLIFEAGLFILTALSLFLTYTTPVRCHSTLVSMGFYLMTYNDTMCYHYTTILTDNLTIGAQTPPAEIFVKLVHKLQPPPPPPILHLPCSHRGNMPCLSKLTTSSLQQSQQTCMGTYLSKIEDWTMVKILGPPMCSD